MKITYRIPTEQYAYVEIEDNVGEGFFDPEKMREQYEAFKETFAEKVGLTAKELDLIIEKMCLGKTVEGGTELWSKATDSQKAQINCLKRALKRIESKHSKKKDEDEEYDPENIGPMDGGVDNWGH